MDVKRPPRWKDRHAPIDLVPIVDADGATTFVQEWHRRDDR
jgi:hypothetical protein